MHTDVRAWRIKYVTTITYVRGGGLMVITQESGMKI